jgi:hypothetical protein
MHFAHVPAGCFCRKHFSRNNFEAVTENTDVKVEVKGMVEEDDGGNKIIMIESFKVLK